MAGRLQGVSSLHKVIISVHFPLMGLLAGRKFAEPDGCSRNVEDVDGNHC